MRAASCCDVTLIYYSDSVSMYAFIITMTLSARGFQHGGSSSWSSRDLSLCIASWGRPAAAASGRAAAGPTRAVPGVAAQTTPAQTVSWSIPIIKHNVQVHINIDLSGKGEIWVYGLMYIFIMRTNAYHNAYLLIWHVLVWHTGLSTSNWLKPSDWHLTVSI